MTGIFNDRSPKPRYTFVWDIETVLNYLSKLPDNLNLPIRALSFNSSIESLRNMLFKYRTHG